MMRNNGNPGLNNGALYGGFNRLRDFPLDASSIVDSREELIQYLTPDSGRHSIAYVGQIIGIRNTGEVIVIKKIPKPGEQIVDIEEHIKSMSTTDDIKVFKEETLALLEKQYATKQELKDEVGKILQDNNTDIIDSFTEVREKFEQIEKWMNENATEIDKIADLETVKSGLADLAKRFEVVESNYATDNELNDAITKAVDKLLGADLEKINQAYDTVKEIADWIEEHREEFDKLDELTDELGNKLDLIQAEYRTEMVGIKETQASQKQTIDLVNTTIDAHQELIEKQEENISSLSEKVNDTESRLDQAESKLDNLSGDYVTKEELESLVGQIDISGVEKTVVLNFGYAGNAAIYNRMIDVIPANSIIREVQILFEKAAQPLNAEPIEDGLFISIQQGENKTNLITYNMIDDEVVTDQNQLPETFIYHLNKLVDADTKIVVEPVNFLQSSGKVFVKFYQK